MAGRESSVALAAIPSEPPGRNVCGWLRSLLGGKSRLIVVGTGGSLAPGVLDRLLRASMPDVERKLRVLDGSPDLAGSLSAAVDNGLYSAGKALQVYCDQEQAAALQRDLAAGKVELDPTVIAITPASVPKDDPNDVRAAAASGDESALHRVLDPHVFSDPASIGAYKAALGESLVREFWSDVAPSRELGIAMVHELLRAALGDRNFESLEYLGSGRNGSAYRTPEGPILKVTTDPAEVESSRRLLGHHLTHVHEVYAVSPLGEFHAILQEGGLEEVPAPYREELDLACVIVEAAGGGPALRAGDEDGLLAALARFPDDEMAAFAAGCLDMFGYPGMAGEARGLGLSIDLHAGNVRLRDGFPVLVDPGTPGEDPGDGQVSPDGQGGLTEYGTGAPGSGANGPASMRSSNSSSWSCGVAALKQPQNHVPQDDNETEDDLALDTDIVGGGLDWGQGRRAGSSF